MRNQAIAMLQEGVSQWEVARRFDVLRHSKPVVVRVFIRRSDHGGVNYTKKERH